VGLAGGNPRKSGKSCFKRLNFNQNCILITIGLFSSTKFDQKSFKNTAVLDLDRRRF